MNNLFKGLIKCSCGKNFNYKPESGGVYVCQRYKNYGHLACPRNILRESDLVHLVKLHCSMASLDDLKTAILMQDIIDRIEVDREMVTIYYKDGTVTKWENNKLSI